MKKLRIYIADVISPDFEMDLFLDRLQELENLVNTLDWVLVLKKIQKKSFPDYNTYLWKWKLEEIINEMKDLKCEVLVLWNVLKSHQIYKINEKLSNIWAQARDRVDLILKIFDKNAISIESKLQIELASIKHMWPRIYWMWMELSRQWWWHWNVRWIWETNTERMKRHLKEKSKLIEKKLRKYENVRKIHREWRKKKWLKTVWVVWYTNVWKSNLLNVLTKKNVISENKLFATLWTNVWSMYIWWNWERGLEVLLNDTIWFIRDLPPNLISAFKSTLEDSVESDLLLHVIDSSDEMIEEKIQIVDKILNDINANQNKLYVFNKIDLVDMSRIEFLSIKYSYLNPIFVSTLKLIWLDNLKNNIKKNLL